MKEKHFQTNPISGAIITRYKEKEDKNITLLIFNFVSAFKTETGGKTATLGLRRLHLCRYGF